MRFLGAERPIGSHRERVGVSSGMTTGGTPATEALRRAGIAFRLHEYAVPPRGGRERDERPAYGIDAAEALGVAPERVFKTLVVDVDGAGLVVAVVPVSHALDLKRCAQAVGGRRAELAEPAVAERATGYVVGGISPIGQRRRLPVVIDASALVHETILVSAGRRGLQVELTGSELARIIGAVVDAISKEMVA